MLRSPSRRVARIRRSQHGLVVFAWFVVREPLSRSTYSHPVSMLRSLLARPAPPVDAQSISFPFTPDADLAPVATMVKPSLLQTLLRQPSQSYSSPSSSRPSSIRSSSSRTSISSERTLDRAPDGSWEWSTFGGRKGLTGGPASLRAPSDVVRAGRGDDARSLRSARSASSLGSGRKKDKEGPSRRYSDSPATSDVSSQRRTVHHTTSEPDLAAPKRHSRESNPPPPVPSLSFSPSSSAFSSPPLTPASSVVSSAKKRRTKQERLDRVDEGAEDAEVYFSAHESSPESVRGVRLTLCGLGYRPEEFTVAGVTEEAGQGRCFAVRALLCRVHAFAAGASLSFVWC